MRQENPLENKHVLVPKCQHFLPLCRQAKTSSPITALARHACRTEPAWPSPTPRSLITLSQPSAHTPALHVLLKRCCLLLKRLLHASTQLGIQLALHGSKQAMLCIAPLLRYEAWRRDTDVSPAAALGRSKVQAPPLGPCPHSTIAIGRALLAADGPRLLAWSRSSSAVLTTKELSAAARLRAAWMRPLQQCRA